MTLQNVAAELEHCEEELFERFCTPTLPVFGHRDERALGGAERSEIVSDGELVPIYRWGTGRSVLLVHGWASRAGHLTAIARRLVDSGLSVIAFDAPAHSRRAFEGVAGQQTNLVRFSRAIVAVAREIGPLRGLVGHSFGALTGTLVVAGGPLGMGPISVERLGLISGSESLDHLIEAWVRSEGLEPDATDAIRSAICRRFGIGVEAFAIGAVAERVRMPALIIHDAKDREVAFSEAERTVQTLPSARLVRTERFGHRRILVAREVIDRIVEFLK